MAFWNRTRKISTPWPTSELSGAQWVMAELFGTENMPVTREMAMRVPAVARARHLITGAISPAPLRAFRGAAEIDSPVWSTRTDGDHPTTWVTWTLDDLIFHGLSVSWVTRGADTHPTRMERIPPERWHLDSDGRVLVDDLSVAAGQVVVIPGPFEGLLDAGSTTIRKALLLEKAEMDRVSNPTPFGVLRLNGEYNPAEAEPQQVLDEFTAMQKHGRGTILLPNGVEYSIEGDVENISDLYAGANNTLTLAVGRFLNVPATMLDASLSSASLTYSTTESSRNVFLDSTVRFWAAPLEARLSQDDVMPRGQRVAFDFENYVSVPHMPHSAERED